MVIKSYLEELLFFRLDKEWSQRSELSSLLEQIQLSQSFGIPPNVLYRYRISGVADARRTMCGKAPVPSFVAQGIQPHRRRIYETTAASCVGAQISRGRH